MTTSLFPPSNMLLAVCSSFCLLSALLSNLRFAEERLLRQPEATQQLQEKDGGWNDDLWLRALCVCLCHRVKQGRSEAEETRDKRWRPPPGSLYKAPTEAAINFAVGFFSISDFFFFSFHFVATNEWRFLRSRLKGSVTVQHVEVPQKIKPSPNSTCWDY